jgi:hypothetical protein
MDTKEHEKFKIRVGEIQLYGRFETILNNRQKSELRKPTASLAKLAVEL